MQPEQPILGSLDYLICICGSDFAAKIDNPYCVIENGDEQSRWVGGGHGRGGCFEHSVCDALLLVDRGGTSVQLHQDV